MMRAHSPHSYLEPGALLRDRYEVLREIGRGGYSVVYAAHDRVLGCDVAVKLLVPPPALAEAARERLRGEATMLRALTHENVVPVYDAYDDGAWSFIVMELVEGRNLEQAVRERGALPLDKALSVARDIAAGLTAAHRAGILHRDVKPSNILLDAHSARLTDFGSAKLTSTDASLTRGGEFLATLEYAAPELLTGERGDARSDVYSLALSIYFALVGQLPPRTASHLPPLPRPEGHRVRALRADVAEWLDDVIAYATSEDPAARFATVADFANALAAAGSTSYTAVRATRVSVAMCALCNAPEPLGIGICVRCSGGGPGDTLVYLQRVHGSEVRAREKQLSALLGQVGTNDARRATAAGQRALVRVPAAAAGRVIEQMALRALPARAVPATQAWRALPPGYYALIAGVVGMGALASTFAPGLVWTGPALAAALFGLGDRSVRRPLVQRERVEESFPLPVQRLLVATFAQLPAGSARTVLADVARAAQPLFTAPHASRHLDSVEALLSAACASALELMRIDEVAAGIEQQRRDPALRAAPEILDAVARCEHAHNAVVQRLLEAVAALRRLAGELLEQPTQAQEQLSELARELDDNARFHAEAVREVELLLTGAAV